MRAFGQRGRAAGGGAMRLYCGFRAHSSCMYVHICAYMRAHGQSLGWQRARVASDLGLRLPMNQQRRGHLRGAKVEYNHTASQNKRRRYAFV